MANSLGREIKEGEIVILDKRYISTDYWEDRRVEVRGGFGMRGFTHGSALSVKWLSDGEEARAEGWMVDPVETKIFQETGQYGNGLTPDPEQCPNCLSFDTGDLSVYEENKQGWIYCNPCGKHWKKVK